MTIVPPKRAVGASFLIALLVLVSALAPNASAARPAPRGPRVQARQTQGTVRSFTAATPANVCTIPGQQVVTETDTGAPDGLNAGTSSDITGLFIAEPYTTTETPAVALSLQVSAAATGVGGLTANSDYITTFTSTAPLVRGVPDIAKYFVRASTGMGVAGPAPITFSYGVLHSDGTYQSFGTPDPSSGFSGTTLTAVVTRNQFPQQPNFDGIPVTGVIATIVTTPTVGIGGPAVADTTTVASTPYTTTGSENCAATGVPLPALSVSLPASITTGQPPISFTGSLTNSTPNTFNNVRYDVVISGVNGLAANQINLQYFDLFSGSYQPVPLFGVITSTGVITGHFGPFGGFSLPLGTAFTTPFSVSVAAGAPGGTLGVTTLLDQLSPTTGARSVNSRE